MEAVIKTQSKSNRWQALLIFLIPAVAMGAAWFMYFTGMGIPDSRTNKGELIVPPVAFAQLSLKAAKTPVGLDQLAGKWGVLVFGSISCEQQGCQDSLYKTRQVHIALGKDADRLIRLYVAPDAPVVSEMLNTEHPEVMWLNADSKQVLKALYTHVWPENRFYIIDPLGNIMMQYSPEQAGGELLKDLKKLMKASKIG